MNKVWFNGRFTEREHISLDSADRAWRFADGGFETFYYNGKEAPLYERHAQRAILHAKTIGAELKIPNPVEIHHILQELAQHSPMRVRLSWFRNAGGFYLPSVSSCSVLIEVSAYNKHTIKRELSAYLYTDQKLAYGKLSAFKKIGCAVYTHAIYQATNKGFDEAILMNTSSEIAECSSSNLILRTGQNFVAPNLSAGAVEGVMLHVLAQKLPELGYHFERKNISIEDLYSADEILSVNSLRGICCITLLHQKRYSASSLQLNEHLNLG